MRNWPHTPFDRPFVWQASGGAAFSPASLFADGDGALIQRRSDAFFVEDYASTHAVDTNAVGFATDGSEGAGYAGGSFTGLGSELWTSTQDYSTGTGSSSDAGGVITISGGGGPNRGRRGLTISGLRVGGVYAINFDVTSLSGTAISLSIDAVAGNSGYIAAADTSAVSSFQAVYTAEAESRVFNFFTGTGGATATIENVSVRELPGNHATQATTSYKPTLQTGGLLFDGNDDRLTGLPAPTTSGTIAARFNGSAASRVIFGSQAASDGRCFLALDASGNVAAGIGAQGTSTITGGADIRGEWHTAAVTWDGSTVTLYLDGVSVYSAAQSGAVNTTVAMMLGALNANGSGAAFWAGTVSDALAIDRVLTTDEITNLNSYWSV